MAEAEALFAYSYHDARARFLRALDAFEQRTDRTFVRQRCAIDRAEDLTIDIAELRPKAPERLYVAVSGIHGVEGYAGNAVQQALIASTLERFDLERCGVMFVHALNPIGMHRFCRVNGGNVDLNRNFSLDGDALYASDSSGYMLISSLLEPREPYDGAFATRARFLAGIASAVARHGFAPLRSSTLVGQYAAPHGIFYGGDAVQPETAFFQGAFANACKHYDEVLLTDFHTGYGERAQAHALFGRADSPEFAQFSAQGVRDSSGRDQAYEARGDLVGHCYETAKRRRRGGIFNGVVLELGTHALGSIEQIRDLHTLVRENQVRQHGACSPNIGAAAQRAFRELFYPSDPRWRQRALDAAITRIEALLTSRGFIA
jgi:hypothetical protein